MNNIRIAIVDSGIAENVSYEDDIIGGVSFVVENDTIFMSDSYDDILGHGTSCASMIKKYCPNALLYIVKVINEQGQGYSVLLLQALEHLLNVDVDIDIINISLSVEQSEYKQEIEVVLQHLKQQGKIVNTSVRNGEVLSFPASVPYCYGVIGVWNKDRIYSFEKKNIIEIQAQQYPEYVETVENKWQWFGGNSKANAMMTGIMGNWINGNSVEVIEHFLSDGKDSIYKHMPKNISEKKIESLLVEVSDLFKKYMNVPDVTSDMKLWNGKKFLINNFSDFIVETEARIGLKLDKNSVTFLTTTDCKQLLRLFL